MLPQTVATCPLVIYGGQDGVVLMAPAPIAIYQGTTPYIGLLNYLPTNLPRRLTLHQLSLYSSNNNNNNNTKTDPLNFYIAIKCRRFIPFIHHLNSFLDCISYIFILINTYSLVCCGLLHFMFMCNFYLLLHSKLFAEVIYPLLLHDVFFYLYTLKVFLL